MRRFGYLEQGRPDSETLYTEEAVVAAIKQVQKFGAIPQTGVIDAATEKVRTLRSKWFCHVLESVFLNDVLVRHS